MLTAGNPSCRMKSCKNELFIQSIQSMCQKVKHFTSATLATRIHKLSCQLIGAMESTCCNSEHICSLQAEAAGFSI